MACASGLAQVGYSPSPLPLENGLKTALGAPRSVLEGISRMGGDQRSAMQAVLVALSAYGRSAFTQPE